MARQTSFGDMLRNARERKGLDLSTAARKLRIRPDILRAIEDGDFARMPPRGYTSNMVGAYARLVGLNPSEVTRAYRDEAYQFETGRRPFDRGERPRSTDRYGDRAGGHGSAPRSSRRTETLEMPSNRSSRGRSTYGGSSRSGRGPAPQPQYTNLVQGRQAPGITANLGSMLPLIIVGAIILILLVLVITLAFGNKDNGADDTPTIPISGMANPSGTDTGNGTDANNTQAPSVEPVAPTSAKFEYKVLDGKEAYIEVYVDGKTEAAESVTGPAEETYDVTGTLRFVTTSPDNVEVTVDGEKLELTDPNSKGVYSCTVDFEEVLDQWKKDNGVSTKGDSSDKSDSKDGSSDSDDEDSTKSSEDDDAAGQSDSGSDDSESSSSGDSDSSDSADSSDGTSN